MFHGKHWHFHLSLIFAGEAGSLPLELNLKQTPLSLTPALSANIRLGWRWQALLTDDFEIRPEFLYYRPQV